MDSQTVCESFLRWLMTFPGIYSLSVPKLSDGVIIGKVLTQIAPEYFTSQWYSKLKKDVGDNWRLKASNLRKILEQVVEFYQESLGLNIKHFSLPDANKIGKENDETEMGKLLVLILACALNCDRKQGYIEVIMRMEECYQTVLMNAVREPMIHDDSSSSDLLGDDNNTDLSNEPASFHPQLKSVLEQLENATQLKEDMIQHCHELELQVSVLSEENKTLKGDNLKLTEKLEKVENGTDDTGSAIKYKDFKKQIDNLQDELFRLEISHDEYRNRVEVLEKENQESHSKNEELQVLADEARLLKDEVDALRGMSEKVTLYEGTLDSYKKKLEELSDLKRQIKILETKNSEYVQQNMELEEEVKKSGTFRQQIEMYKMQIAELHQKLSDEAKNADRHIFENKKLNEKVEVLATEKERLISERDALKENIEELRCQQSSTTADNYRNALCDGHLLEMIPPEIRQLNQHIIELESQIEDVTSSPGPSEVPCTKPTMDPKKLTDLEMAVSEQRSKIASLSEALSKKESEMAAMEERYKKYLGKAKSVIKTLDPKQNPSLVPDISTLRQQIHDKNCVIEKLERESEKTKQIREMEEKLITTAFHNYTMQMQRQMVATRITALEQAQPFLSRQRQANARRGQANQIGHSEFCDY